MNITRIFRLCAAAFCLFGLSAATLADYPAGYYDDLEGKCGTELMDAIRARCINHTEISYSSGTWDAFKTTDVQIINGQKYWWDMYSPELVAAPNSHPGLNVEHSVANSWWGGTKNAAYKDIVHLNPSNSDANSRKSNYPLAELGTVTWTNGVTNVGKPVSGQGGGATYCYEPCDEYKGDFARTFMYMFTVYSDISWKENTAWMYSTANRLIFQGWASDLLLKWSVADPVSEKETARNDGIYICQKNRNPFIDLPTLADHIWGDKATEPFYIGEVPDPKPDPNPNPDPNPAPDPQPDPVVKVYEWLAATSPSLTEGWTYENVEMDETLSYIWSWKNINSKYYLNASAYVSGKPYAAISYAWSPEVTMPEKVEATLTFSHAAKFQTTLRSLCKIAVKDVNTSEIFHHEITAWPTAGTWDFVNAGSYDLSAYAGKTIRVGFKYESDTTGADTWEINDAKFTVKDLGESSVEDVADCADDSFLVEVWGRNILVPAGARIFDLNGRPVDGEGIAPGIYIVAKPSFRQAVKVIVR